MIVRIEVVWDMETGDPDDFFRLLLGHLHVDLPAVTVTPEQAGVAKCTTERMVRGLPIKSLNLNHGSICVST